MSGRLNPNPTILHFVLKRNKYFPNNKLPVLIYTDVLKLPAGKQKKVIAIQKIFMRNGWSNSWQNGIYDFHHYHSTTHECMGIAAGTASIILGGPKGRKTDLTAGDVIIIPAGVGHKCLKYSEDFLCVGAYPQGKDYDTNLGKAHELLKARSNIHSLSLPAKDPLFGKEGFIKIHWKKK